MINTPTKKPTSSTPSSPTPKPPLPPPPPPIANQINKPQPPSMQEVTASNGPTSPQPKKLAKSPQPTISATEPNEAGAEASTIKVQRAINDPQKHMTFPEDESTNTPPIERTDGLGTALPNPIVPSAKEDNGHDPLPPPPSTVPFHVDDKTKDKFQAIMAPSMFGVKMSRQRPVPMSRTLPIRPPHAVPVQQARDPPSRQGHHPDQWEREAIGTYTPSSTVPIGLPNPTVHTKRKVQRHQRVPLNVALDHEPAPGMHSNKTDGRGDIDVIGSLQRTQEALQVQMNQQTQISNQILAMLQQQMATRPVPPRAADSTVDNPFQAQLRTHVREGNKKKSEPDPSAKRRIVPEKALRKTSGISENDLDAGEGLDRTVTSS